MTILQYIGSAFKGAFFQLLVVLGPSLVLAIAMHFLSTFIQQRTVYLVGFKAWLILFKAIGTPIHELGHAVFCLIFGHKIDEMALFKPSPDGTLGYVNHRYNKRNLYHQIGNFFIGIGPIILGSVVILGAAYFLVGKDLFTQAKISPDMLINAPLQAFTEAGRGLGETFSLLFKASNFLNWKIYVFLYLVFAIGNSITLSPPDLKSAGIGFLYFIVFLLVLNLATSWAGNFLNRGAAWLGSYMVVFATAMVAALFLNLGAAVLLLILSAIKSRARAR